MYSDEESDDDDVDDDNWDDLDDEDEEQTKQPTKALFTDDILESPEAVLEHAKEKHGVDMIDFIAKNRKFGQVCLFLYEIKVADLLTDALKNWIMCKSFDWLTLFVQ